MGQQDLGLKLDMETVSYLRDLAKVLSEIKGEMEQSDSRLIKSFEAVWDSLGIHTKDIQALVNTATAAEKTVQDSAKELARMLNNTAQKIEDYVNYKHGKKA